MTYASATEKARKPIEIEVVEFLDTMLSAYIALRRPAAGDSGAATPGTTEVRERQPYI